MATTNITGSGTHPQTFEASLCSPVWVGEFKKQSFSQSVSFILSSQHSILHHSDSWELSYPSCPSHGIFPASTIQTLVSLSGNN